MKQTSNKAKLNKQVEIAANSIAAQEEYYQDIIDQEHQKSYDLVRDGTGDDLTGIWEPDVKAFISPSSLKSLFFNDDWVFIVVDLIAKKISSQQLKVMRGIVVDGSLQSEPNEAHPIQRLIEKPNNFQDYHAWMYSMIVDLALIGNAIQWRGKVNNKIMALPAEIVRIDFAQDGSIIQYVTNEAGEEGAGRGKTAAFPVIEIAHLRIPNPASMIWGMSPFIPGRRSVLFNRYSSEYLNNFYLKGATPGMALEMDKEANEKVALRLLRSFEGAYTGRRNQRRTMVLPKGVSAKEMSHTLADQQLAIYIDKNRETILAMLKVPKHEVGLQASGSLGSEEHKTALKNFWEATLVPMMRIVAGGLTQFFAQDLGPDNFLEFDLEDISALKDDEIAKANLAEKMLNTHTLNEVRKKLYDDPPLTGGDDTPKPKQGGSGQMFGLSAQSPGQQVQSGVQISAPGGRPSAETELLSETVEETKVTLPGKRKADVAKFKKANESWFRERERKIAAEAKRGIEELEAMVVRIFSDMSTFITMTARKFLKQKGYSAEQTKATVAENPNKPRPKLVGTAELRRRLRNGLDKFEEIWIVDTRKALTSTIEVGYDTIIQVPFNMPSQNEIAALRERGKQVRVDALEERESRAFRYINEATINKVFGTIERGIDQNKTVDQIAESLRDKFSNISEIQSRAQTIARTEVLTAVSLGQAAAMQDIASVVPNVKKMWVTADDDRVRDTHIALDGDVEDWDSAFATGLFFPRDPGGQPEETINCRCTLVVLPSEQMDEVSGENLVANENP